MNRISALLLILILNLVSCELPKNKNDEQINDQPSEETSPGVISKEEFSYSLKTIKKSTGNCDNGGCAKVKVIYPEYEGPNGKFINGKIEQRVSELLLDMIPNGGAAKSPIEAVEAILKDFKSVQEEFGDLSEQWDIKVTIDVSYRKDNLISIVIKTDSYTGGAHGSNTLHYVNYDWRKRKELNFDQIVTDKGKLTQIAEIHFRKTNNIKNGQSLNDAGYYFENGFELNKNIGYTENGLNIYFNSNEIAPYAMGPSSINIPYKDLKGLLSY